MPFLIVLQADLLRDFGTVVVAPLRTETTATKINRLNPIVTVLDKSYRASMAEFASILRSHLGEVVKNVEDQHREFVAAIDLIFTGI